MATTLQKKASRFKVGLCFRATEEISMKLTKSSYHRIERDGVLATRLCTHKDDVELTNEDKLQQLPGLNPAVCVNVPRITKQVLFLAQRCLSWWCNVIKSSVRSWLSVRAGHCCSEKSFLLLLYHCVTKNG